MPGSNVVMHGSSSVPQDWLKIINEFGGDIPETYGVPVEEIQEGIKHGVRKINIDTDLRLASTGAIRRFMAQNKAAFDPRQYLGEATAAMSEICKARYEAFGTAGWAGKIKIISLEAMTQRYQSGDLDPQVNMTTNQTMLYGIEVNIIYMSHQVVFITDSVFPKPLLPDTAFTVLAPCLRDFRFFASDIYPLFGKPALYASPSFREIGIIFWQFPNAV